MSDNDIQVLATKFTSDVEEALKGIQLLKEAINSVVSTSEVFNKAMSSSASQLEKLMGTVTKTVQEFDKLNASLSKAHSAKPIQDLTAAQTDLNKAQEEGSGRTQVFAQALEHLKSRTDLSKIQMAGITGEMVKLDNQLQKLQTVGLENTFGRLLDPINFVEEAISRYGQSAKYNVGANEALVKANRSLVKSLSDKKLALDDAAFSLSNLGKTIMDSVGRSDAYRGALLQLSKNTGAYTTDNVSFVKALDTVEKHLQSVAKGTYSYELAQKALNSQSSLVTLTSHLMAGNIKKVEGGFLSLNEKAGVSGVVFSQFKAAMAGLKNQSESFLTAFENFSTAQKRNNEAMEIGKKRLNDFDSASKMVQSAQTNVINRLKESGQAYTDLNGRILSSKELETKLSDEKKTLIKALNDENLLRRIVTGELQASEKSIRSHVAASHSELLSVNEMNKEYFGLNESLRKVGEYGKVYVDALTQRTKGHITDRAAIETHTTAIEKYAQIAQGMIAQSKSISAELIANAKDFQMVNGQLLSREQFINRVTESTSKFEEVLTSQTNVLKNTSSANRINTESMLNFAESQGVATEMTSRLRNSAYELLRPMQGYEKEIGFLNEQIKKYNLTNYEAKKQLDNLVAVRKAHEQALKEEQKRIEEQSKKLKEQPGIIQRTINKLKELSTYYTSAAILYGLTTAVRGAISAMSDFDQTVHSVKAITGATDTEMRVLGETMRDVARNSRYSVEQVGVGLKLMGQAGLDAVQSMNSIKAATDLAIGTLEDMEPVVDLLTTTLTAFKMNSMESTRVADIFAVAINKSKLSVDKLRTAFNYVGLTAAQTGLSLEETNASLMVMADAGMKASTMGTSFRQVLAKLIAPNDKLREAYTASGIELQKINPLVSGYGNSLKSLSDVLWDTEKQTVDVAKAYELFGLRGAQAAIAIVRSFVSGDYQKALDDLNESGMAASMAAEQLEGLSAKFERLMSKVKELAITFGESGFSSILKDIIDMLALFVDGLRYVIATDFDPFIVTITASVIAFGVGLKVTTLLMRLFGISTLTVSGIMAAHTAAVNLTTAALARLKLAYISDPPLFFIGVILSAVIAFYTWQSQISGVTKKLEQNTLKLRTQADTLDIFSKALEKTAGRGKAYESMLLQFSEEHKDLTERILETTGASSLFSLEFEELQKRIKEIQLEILNQGLQNSLIILAKNTASLKEAELEYADFSGKIKDLGVAVGKYNESLQEVAKTALSWKNQTKSSTEAVEEHLKSLGILPENVKKVIDAIDKLEKKQKRMESVYQQTARSGLTSFSAMYQGLDALQKADLIGIEKQKEEELARLDKFATEHIQVEEDKLALIAAIEMKYNLIAIEKRSDFKKKALESEADKFDRMIAMTKEKLDEIERSTEGHSKNIEVLQDKLKFLLEKKSAERIGVVERDLKNEYAIIELNQKEKEKLISQYNNFLLEKLQLNNKNILNNMKAQSDLELALYDDLETEKLSFKIKSSELEWQTAREYSEKAIQLRGKESEEAIKAMQVELEKRKEVVVAQMALIERLTGFIEEKYKTEQILLEDRFGILQKNLDNELALELANANASERNLLRREQNIRNIKERFSAQKISLIQEEYNAEVALLDEKYSKLARSLESESEITKNILDNNYSARFGLEQSIQGLMESSVDKYVANLNKMGSFTQMHIDSLDKDWEKHFAEQKKDWARYGDIVYVMQNDMVGMISQAQGKETEIVKETNEKKRQLDLKYFEERKALVEDALKAYTSELQAEYTQHSSFRESLKSLYKEKEDIDNAYHEALRKNRQLKMTDEKKYYDDLKEINRLYNLGRSTGDREFFNKAIQLNESYTSEIQGSGNSIAVELNKVLSTRESWIRKLYKAQQDAIEEEKRATEKNAEESLIKIKSLEEAVKSLEQAKENLIKDELIIKTEGASKSIQDVFNQIDELRKKIDYFKTDGRLTLNIDHWKAQLENARLEMENLVLDFQKKKAEVPINVVGGEKKEDLETFFNSVKEKVSAVGEDLKDIAFEINAQVTGKTGGEESKPKTFDESMNEVKEKVSTIASAVGETPIDVSVNVLGKDNTKPWETVPLLDEIKAKVDALQNKDLVYNITVNGLDDLIEAVKFQNELKDKTVTHTINVVTNYSSSGSSSSEGSAFHTTGHRLGGLIEKIKKFAGGGGLGGYGGGDIVPALLEPGEFVMRKEAVKKYGSSFFKMWNDLKVPDLMGKLLDLRGFSLGGMVFPKSKINNYSSSSRTEIGQGSLNIVEFRIGTESHRLYGEENAIKGLMTNLRRSRLVTV